MIKRATRGYGLLENFLAKKRAKIATRLLLNRSKSGRILDIGCGTYPYFLISTDFKKKYGLDKIINKKYHNQLDYIKLVKYDIEKERHLPFNNNYFNAVTMLATLEHIDPHKTVPILKEIRRVLKKNGVLIITTPASWSAPLLNFLTKLRLVSAKEIAEHKSCYNIQKLFYILKKSGFDENYLEAGYFEAGMNIWIRAR